MAEEYGSEQIQKTSKLNSGMLQIYRLNVLWKDASKYATLGLYNKWNDVLDRIWCELAGGIKDKETIELYAKLTAEYAKSIKGNPKRVGFETFSDEDLQNMVLQKQTLMDKEIFLRGLEDKQGMGRGYDEEDDYFE